MTWDGSFQVRLWDGQENNFGAAYGATDTVNFTVYISEVRVWDLPVE